jgi:hypothetical protein
LGLALTVTQSAPAGLHVTYRQVVKSANPNVEIDVSRPEFRSGPLAAHATEETRNLAQVAQTEFRASIPRPMIGPRPWSLWVKPTVTFARTDVVSGYYTISEYTGGAHPNTGYSTFNFHRVNGRNLPLRLRDLLRDGVNPREFALSVAGPEIRAARIKRGSDPEGEIPAGFEERFVLSSYGVTWLFAPYELGSYAEGSYFIKVPWSRMTEALNPAVADLVRQVPIAGAVTLPEDVTLPHTARLRMRLLHDGREISRREMPAHAPRMSIRDALPTFGVNADNYQVDIGVYIEDARAYSAGPMAMPASGTNSLNITLTPTRPRPTSGDEEMAPRGYVRLAGTVLHIRAGDKLMLEFRLFDARTGGRLLGTRRLAVTGNPVEFDTSFPDRLFDVRRPRYFEVALLQNGKVVDVSAERRETTIYGWESPGNFRL